MSGTKKVHSQQQERTHRGNACLRRVSHPKIHGAATSIVCTAYSASPKPSEPGCRVLYVHVCSSPSLSAFHSLPPPRGLSPDAGAHDLELLSKSRVLVDIFLVFSRELLQAAFERCHHSRNVAQVFLRDFLTDGLKCLQRKISKAFGQSINT